MIFTVRYPAARLSSKANMKELIIVRHAKSNWGDASVDDHERTLNGRGERDAPRMAELLAGKLSAGDSGVDTIISSSAQRAKATAMIFVKGLNFPEADVQIKQSGYLASAHEWLRILTEVDETAQRVMIFGHNPGLEVLADQLLRPGESVGALPTCAVVRIRLDVEFWGAIGENDGRLIECLKPREVL